jgi:polyferredoxin
MLDSLRYAISIPFKLLHRIVGAVVAAVIVTTLVAFLASVIGGFVALILAAIVAGAAWLCLFFAATILGSALLALARVFDPDYFQGKENTATTVMNAVKGRGDELRTMARDHL